MDLHGFAASSELKHKGSATKVLFDRNPSRAEAAGEVDGLPTPVAGLRGSCLTCSLHGKAFFLAFNQRRALKIFENEVEDPGRCVELSIHELARTLACVQCCTVYCNTVISSIILYETSMPCSANPIRVCTYSVITYYIHTFDIECVQPTRANKMMDLRLFQLYDLSRSISQRWHYQWFFADGVSHILFLMVRPDECEAYGENGGEYGCKKFL